MKRSKINEEIDFAKNLLKENNFYLPSFGYWAAEDFLERDGIERIVKLMLGWDITDYGLGRFDEIGGTLFTLRNGIKGINIGTPYAEKLIILKEGQRLPLHYHIEKTEDIINRFGGLLSIKLFNSIKGKIDYNSEVVVYIDSIKERVSPGEEILLRPGQGITIEPYMYHLFKAKESKGDLVCGEVSSINDDFKDNYFAEEIARFSDIEEDEQRRYVLCNEYSEILL